MGKEFVFPHGSPLSNNISLSRTSWRLLHILSRIPKSRFKNPEAYTPQSLTSLTLWPYHFYCMLITNPKYSHHSLHSPPWSASTDHPFNVSPSLCLQPPAHILNSHLWAPSPRTHRINSRLCRVQTCLSHSACRVPARSLPLWMNSAVLHSLLRS